VRERDEGYHRDVDVSRRLEKGSSFFIACDTPTISLVLREYFNQLNGNSSLFKLCPCPFCGPRLPSSKPEPLYTYRSRPRTIPTHLLDLPPEFIENLRVLALLLRQDFPSLHAVKPAARSTLPSRNPRSCDTLSEQLSCQESRVRVLPFHTQRKRNRNPIRRCGSGWDGDDSGACSGATPPTRVE